MSRQPHDALTADDRERHKRIAGDLGLTSSGVSQRLRRIGKVLGARSVPNAIALYIAPEKYRKP